MNMKFRKLFPITVLILSIVGMFAGCSSKENVTATTGAYSSPMGNNGVKTLENLQTAFNGETNANAKYLEYAKKADAEGFTKVASLYRAAARAEEIHAGNHAVVIRKMGGTPKSEVKLPEIKTTRENLEDSVKGETYERDTMYPEFLLEARNTNNKDALKTFNLAKTAEAEHAKLYAEALGNLESWKGGTTTFYVCPSCGYTTTNPDLEKCPVDFVPKEKFEEIK